MPNIRIIAAAVAAAVFAFSQAPAHAASCDDGDAGCSPRQVAQQDAPMKLDNFMKTWKPVSGTRSAKKSKKSRHTRDVAKQTPKPAATPAPEETTPAPAVAAAPAAAVAAVSEAAAPTTTHPNETDGVAVTSSNEMNTLDAATPPSLPEGVQVVASNDVNEIDLAAPPTSAPTPAPTETVAQAAAPQPEPVNSSWIGKLLLAAAGTIAVAGAARLLVA